MSEQYLPKIIRDNFREKKKAFCDQLIKEYQKEYERKMYIEKSPEDKIICPICKGRYVRTAKSKHAKTKKHLEKINEIYNFIE